MTIRTFTASRTAVAVVQREPWEVDLDAARRRIAFQIEISAVRALGRHANRCNALRTRQEFRFDRVERRIKPRLHRYRMRDLGIATERADAAFRGLAAAWDGEAR